MKATKPRAGKFRGAAIVAPAAFFLLSAPQADAFFHNSPDLEQGRAIYEAEISTLARLHNYDPNAIGLSDFGKPGNYFARQIDRWTKQYRASETEKIEAMAKRLAKVCRRSCQVTHSIPARLTAGIQMRS